MNLIRLGFTMLALSSSIFAQDKDYQGAELFSSETFQFGRFEARMYMGAGSGLVSSMFTYYNDSYKGGVEPWREIDIEVLGKSPESFQSNIISGSASKKVMSELHHAISPVANSTYHTYAIEWTPDYIAWYLDGQEVRRTDSTSQQVIDLRDKEQNLRFNLWAANLTSWVGAFDPSILPVHQYINWVKVYQYTPKTGPNGSDFTLHWQDDFDTFDDARWGTANWTFTENLTDLVPENVTVSGGTLVLSITRAGLNGFTGTVPVDDGSTAIRPPFRNTTGSASALSPKFDLLGRTTNKSNW